MSALDFQVGGDHYKDCAYQPVQFINDLDLNFIQGNITKYLTRYKRKDGKKDIEKILHYGCLGGELNPRYYGNGDRDKTLYYAKCNNISPHRIRHTLCNNQARLRKSCTTRPIID